MKIFGLALMRCVPDEMESAVYLSSAYDMSSFGFFQKSAAKEFMRFFGRTILSRTTPGKRQSTAHDDYMVHTYLRSSGLGVVLISDAEYPSRVAFSLASQLMERFLEQFAQETWSHVKADCELPFEYIKRAIVDFQDPAEADKITKIQKDLDETIDIVHKTIDSVLDRGDKINNLVKQSEDLSAQSKLFFETAASQNRCCVLM